MTTKRRIAAMAMCLWLLLVMFFSTAYIIREADHNCTGENCPICHQIQICRQILNTVGTAAFGAAVFSLASVFLTAPTPVHRRESAAVTLISLKVKLSD